MSDAAKRWRECAKRMRMHAEQVLGEEAKLALLVAAEDYEQMAAAAERQKRPRLPYGEGAVGYFP